MTLRRVFLRLSIQLNKDQKKDEYREGIQCHFCIDKFSDDDRKRFEERQNQMNQLKGKSQMLSKKK